MLSGLPSTDDGETSLPGPPLTREKNCFFFSRRVIYSESSALAISRSKAPPFSFPLKTRSRTSPSLPGWKTDEDPFDYRTLQGVVSFRGVEVDSLMARSTSDLLADLQDGIGLSGVGGIPEAARYRFSTNGTFIPRCKAGDLLPSSKAIERYEATPFLSNKEVDYLSWWPADKVPLTEG